jgi:hypothetical protein
MGIPLDLLAPLAARSGCRRSPLGEQQAHSHVVRIGRTTLMPAWRRLNRMAQTSHGRCGRLAIRARGGLVDQQRCQRDHPLVQLGHKLRLRGQPRATLSGAWLAHRRNPRDRGVHHTDRVPNLIGQPRRSVWPRRRPARRRSETPRPRSPGQRSPGPGGLGSHGVRGSSGRSGPRRPGIAIVTRATLGRWTPGTSPESIRPVSRAFACLSSGPTGPPASGHSHECR